MALFKIFKGPEEELQEVPCHEGYAYFTTDRGNLYIDIATSETVDENRVQVSAAFANALRKVSEDGEQIEYIQYDDVRLKKDVIDVAHGGTGLKEITPNAVLIGNGTGALKLVTIDKDSILTADNDGVKALTGTGALYKLTEGALTFGNLPLTAGGTGANSADGARTNLEVYSKKEIDLKIAGATSQAYAVTLAVADWTVEDDHYAYNYQNTKLSCGSGKNIPPIISYTSNLEEYSKILDAEATPDQGIKFTIKEQPKSPIEIVVIDVK